MLNFDEYIPPAEPKVSDNQDIPKEMDIFFRKETAFLPPGKTFEDLTPEELKDVMDKYRFDAMKPGLYQQITGISTTGGLG